MQLQYIISLIWFESFGLGAIQQLRGQEEGEGGQQKVHTFPPRGDFGCPRRQKFEKKV